jgi:hypothetical protein
MDRTYVETEIRKQEVNGKLPAVFWTFLSRYREKLSPIAGMCVESFNGLKKGEGGGGRNKIEKVCYRGVHHAISRAVTLFRQIAVASPQWAVLPLWRLDCDSIKKNHFTVAYWSNLQFVMALLLPERPRCDDYSPRNKCSRLFFLDRIAVASPQWENGLYSKGITSGTMVIVAMWSEVIVWQQWYRFS